MARTQASKCDWRVSEWERNLIILKVTHEIAIFVVALAKKHTRKTTWKNVNKSILGIYRGSGSRVM